MNKHHWHNKPHHEGKYWHQYGFRIINYRLHEDLKFTLWWKQREARTVASDRISDRKYSSVHFKYTTV